MDSDWCSQGITSSSLVETWFLPIPEGCDLTEGNAISVAGDGSYLYFHGPFGLLKVGSGYANTKKVGGRNLVPLFSGYTGIRVDA